MLSTISKDLNKKIKIKYSPKLQTLSPTYFSIKANNNQEKLFLINFQSKLMS